MNAIIKKRLQALEKAILPYSGNVVVTLPTGENAVKSAVEWWEHREEWGLADFRQQSSRSGLVAYLVFAALADEAIEKAESPHEAENLIAERDFMLKAYFGTEVEK